MHFLALDLGTTHIKAAVVSARGEILAASQVPSEARRTAHGFVYDPEEFWQKAVTVIERSCQEAERPRSLRPYRDGESGLLVDKHPSPRSSTSLV